jgi:endonuclease/exonuclease/phosphatase family metal-dependent hydrolase
MRSIPEVPLSRRKEILAAPIEAGSHARLLDALGFDAMLEIGGVPGDVAARGDASLRVVAWNAQRCGDPEAALALLRASGADVFLLSELDHGMARTKQRHTARELAAGLGARYAFGVEFLELGLGDAHERAAHSGSENAVGHHGGAVLCRRGLRDAALVRLEDSGRWFDGALGERRVGGRIAVLARLPLGDREIAFASVHLENEADPGERAAQLEVVFAALEDFAPGAPALVGGDVNTHSLTRAELHDRELLKAALVTDPSRLANPVPHEPLFALAEARGYDWQRCNAVGAATHRLAQAGASARPTLALDWFFARGLEVEDPAVIAAVDPANGAVLSDHELIAVTIRVR